jgi:hypothetical protein
MSRSKAVDAVRCAVAALNDGNIAGYLGYFDPSCERRVAGFAQPLTLDDVGDGLRQLDAAFAGLRLDEDLLFGDERFACARWRMRGLHVNDYLGVSPAGQSIAVETCEVYELGNDGVVVASWVYGDLLGQLLGQIAADVGEAT